MAESFRERLQGKMKRNRTETSEEMENLAGYHLMLRLTHFAEISADVLSFFALVPQAKHLLEIFLNNISKDYPSFPSKGKNWHGC